MSTNPDLASFSFVQVGVQGSENYLHFLKNPPMMKVNHKTPSMFDCQKPKKNNNLPSICSWYVHVLWILHPGLAFRNFVFVLVYIPLTADINLDLFFLEKDERT